MPKQTKYILKHRILISDCMKRKAEAIKGGDWQEHLRDLLAHQLGCKPKKVSK